MDHLSKDKIEHQDVLKNKLATHVVTQIQYGADAFFVFDRQKTSSSDKINIGGSLKAEVSGLTLASRGMKASVDVNERSKNESQNTNCTYYGDCFLSSIPTNIQEARQSLQVSCSFIYYRMFHTYF
jgi:hypothetical protein